MYFSIILLFFYICSLRCNKIDIDGIVVLMNTVVFFILFIMFILCEKNTLRGALYMRKIKILLTPPDIRIHKPIQLERDR